MRNVRLCCAFAALLAVFACGGPPVAPRKADTPPAWKGEGKGEKWWKKTGGASGTHPAQAPSPGVASSGADAGVVIPPSSVPRRASPAEGWAGSNRAAKLGLLSAFNEGVLAICAHVPRTSSEELYACMDTAGVPPKPEVVEAMDAIYQDPAYAEASLWSVAEAAWIKVRGGDWKRFLARANARNE